MVVNSKIKLIAVSVRIINPDVHRESPASTSMLFDRKAPRTPQLIFAECWQQYYQLHHIKQ